MLNYLWAGMILIGMIYGGIRGNLAQIGDGILDSSKEAVTLCITMLGILCLWTGIMEIAKDSGIIDRMTRVLEPFLRFMFPNLKKGNKAREHITTNIIANILGLGWAATPAGLEAMVELTKNEISQTKSLAQKGAVMAATDEMCTFLVINISSLQLIPVNIIAYRSQYGSVNPTAIVAPALIATFVSTLAGVIFCKIMCRRKKSK